MPRISNRNAGIKNLGAGRYQARVFHNGKEESRNFSRLDEAQRWQRNLKADLERAPQEIARKKREWVATLVTPIGVASKAFPALTDAVAWVEQGKLQISMGTWVNPDQQNVTFGEYVTSWRTSKTSISGKTLATYASLLKNHILPTLEEQKLTGISTSDIRSWVSDLERARVGATTIRQSYRLLHQILESAVVDELLMRNPAIGVRLPKKSKSKSSALTAQQVNDLAKECGKYGLLISFLASTGLRVNEALALRVEDVDLVFGAVHVERTWTSTESGKKILGQPKTREVRDVPLTSDLRVQLGLHLKGKSTSDWVFQGDGGDALDYGYFRRAYFQPSVKKLALGNVTIHSLRHTAASLLVSLGAPILDVSRVLGHASAKMTLDIYGHSYSENAAAWVEKLGELYIQPEAEL